MILRWDTLTNKVNENNKNIAKTLSYKREYIKQSIILTISPEVKLFTRSQLIEKSEHK